MDDRRLQRGILLFEQSNYAGAEDEFRQHLLTDPEHPVAHALLAMCLSEREAFDEATQEARLAIGCGPDIGLTHYAHASILHDRNRYSEALEAIRTAIAIDSHHPEFFALQGAIHLAEKRWAEALVSADEGLKIAPEHPSCGNVRGAALIQLGRNNEANQTIEGMLERSPNDANSHANQGFLLLHQGDYRKASEHFREALRIDPHSERARAGMLESLKARNLIYRWILKFFLAMSKLSDTGQWVVILGLWLLYRFVRSTARANPELAPYLNPLLIVYGVFVLATWFAAPLSNLIIRMDRFGRHVLSNNERRESNVFGAVLLTAIGLGAAWCFLGSPFGAAAIITALLLLPVSAVFRCGKGWPRSSMTVYTLGVAAVGAASLFVPDLFLIFVVGCVLSGFVGNALAMQTVRQ